MEMTANTCLSIVLNPLSPPLVFNKLNPLVIFISDAVARTPVPYSMSSGRSHQCNKKSVLMHYKSWTWKAGVLRK